MSILSIKIDCRRLFRRRPHRISTTETAPNDSDATSHTPSSETTANHRDTYTSTTRYYGWNHTQYQAQYLLDRSSLTKSDMS